jgi:hypothetical protein
VTIASKASTVMEMRAAPNALGKALREIGRVERSIFRADWLMDLELRRRSHANFNKARVVTLWRGPCSSTAWASFAAAPPRRWPTALRG